MNKLFSGFALLMCLLSADSYAQRNTVTAVAENAFLPVVPGRTDNPVLQIKLTVRETTRLKELHLKLGGTVLPSAIQQVNIYATGVRESFTRDSSLFAVVPEPKPFLKVKGSLELQKGDHYIWVALVVKPGVSLNERISVVCKSVALSSGRVQPVIVNSTDSRMGLALRSRGQDGVHTYRIPGLATTGNGTLIGVYDVRYNNSQDLQEDINVGLNRSTDGGQTWEPMKIIMDMNTWGGLPRNQNGIGDPCILVDNRSNTIWVAGLWAHGHPKERTWNASQPGMLPAETGQVMLVKSTDDGITWSEPVNITAQVKQPDWRLFLQGPGKGITMKDGTLVFPAQFKDSENVPYSTIMYSRDGGNTWKTGTGARSHTTEAQVIELSDGSLMLNMRDDRGRDGKSGSRAVSVTKDLGVTWQEHPTSRRALIEPVCMASLDRFDFRRKDGSLLPLVIFSNPASVTTRNNITLRISKDEGMTWPAEYDVLLDKGTAAGYTCLTQIDDHTVGILYESSKAHLLFQTIDLRQVLGEE